MRENFDFSQEEVAPLKKSPRIYRAFFLVLIAADFLGVSAARAAGTAYFSAKSGSWSDATVWSPVGVPGDGDTAFIQSAVTVDGPVTIGQSQAGAVALTILTGSTLTIVNGGVLTLRGDVLQRGMGFAQGLGGGRIVFDATATSPTTTTYTWKIGDDYYTTGFPKLTLAGTSSARFRVESAAGGGNGRFVGSVSGGGAVDAQYTDFVRIGDASFPALAPNYEFRDWPLLSLAFCRFVACGSVTTATSSIGSGINFNISDCQFIRPIGAPVQVGSPGVSSPNITRCDFGTGPVLRSGFNFSGNIYRAAWTLDNAAQSASPPPYSANIYNLTGPTADVLGTAATYTLSLDPNNTSSGVMITPSDGGAGGTFAPVNITLTTQQPSLTFTYTASTLGPRALLATNNQMLWDADSLSIVVTTPLTTYTLQAPSPATCLVGHPSDEFAVSLGNYHTFAGSVVVTPNDGNHGGSFVPSSVTLTTDHPSASFTYTANQAGSMVVSIGNNQNLSDPSPVTITASNNAVTSYAFSGPNHGDVSETSSLFTVTLGAGAMTGHVRITPSASNSDGIFAPAFVDLTNSLRAATFVYTPASWGLRQVSVTNDGNLQDPSALPFLSKVQLGSTGEAPAGNRTPDLGGFDLFANGAWLQEFKHVVVNDAVAPNSDALMDMFSGHNLVLPFYGSTVKGGNSLYSQPFNIVSGDQPLLPMHITTYASESDAGPVPFLPNMSVEAWYSPLGLPPSTADYQNLGGDHHGLVMRRNESTGGIDRLYEYYQVGSDDAGSNWFSVGGAQFDLTTGAPRTEGWTSAEAGGMSIQALVLHYDEAMRGDNGIKHALRGIIGATEASTKFVWPGRHSVGGWNPAGLPMGARIRLKKSYYDANVSGLSPINRAILTALVNYGIIIADLGQNHQLWLDGTNDDRWDPADLNNIRNIPPSAFEVLDTIKPEVIVTGPSAGQVNIPQTFTMRHTIAKDSNFSNFMYAYWSTDGGAHLNAIGTAAMIDDTHRGPILISFTPPAAGTYFITVVGSGIDGWIVAGATMTTTDHVTTYSLIAPASLPPDSVPLNQASENFTVAPNGDFTGTITLDDGGAGGTFTPSSLSWSNAHDAKTFTYTAASRGPKTITASSGGSLIDPAPVVVQVIAPATAYTLSGPATAFKNQPSSNFVMTPNGNFTGVITPSDGGSGGTFLPSTLTWNGTSEGKTFSYIPTSTGNKTISTSNNGSLADPSALTVAVLDWLATRYTLTGPTEAIVGQPSHNFTVTPDGPFTGTITPSDGNGGGIFTPSQLSWSSTPDAKTFTYTPATIGIKVISTTDDAGLTNPAALNLIVSLNGGGGDGPPPSGSLNSVVITPTVFKPLRGDTEVIFSALPSGVSIRIYNQLGQRIKELMSDESGIVHWNVKDDRGQPLPSGICSIVLEGNGKRAKKKMAVVR